LSFLQRFTAKIFVPELRSISQGPLSLLSFRRRFANAEHFNGVLRDDS
jgi:hypothetical protein